jgi:hypothetical protein
MLDMFAQLGTPADKKAKEAIPNAGSHVIGSYIRSKDLLSVQTAIENFMQHTLNLPKTANGGITEVTK